MNCKDCTTDSLYARSESVPFLVHESDMARLEASQKATIETLNKTNKRWFVTVISLIAALVASWVGFFVYEAQFETVEESKTQEVWQDSEGDGYNSFVGGDNYGSATHPGNDD